MAKRIKVKEGDIFTIPISESKVGLGQIIFVDKYGYNLYVIIFKEDFNTPLNSNELSIDKLTPFLIGGTMDARIYHGMWEIIGSKNISSSHILKPNFIIGTDSKRVESFEGKYLREASPEDLKRFDYRSSRAPIAFENLLKSEVLGIEKPVNWEKLTFNYSKLKE